jgi:hypothetical protein
MQVQRLGDPVAFLDRASALLLTDEARHNLVFGICESLVHHPGLYPAWDLWLVEDGERVVGAALQTPPHNLVIARPADDEALEALASAIHTAGVAPPGVSGADPEASVFADRWVVHAGGTWRLRMGQGVYALTEILPVATAAGEPRLAGAEDEPLLAAWIGAFAHEATVTVLRDAAAERRALAARLGQPPDRGGFWLWEAGGETVSLSGHGGATPTGIRIGPVYTPPEHRGRGYATSLVHAQSSWLLAHGRRCCFLYTDIGNETSNRVYRRIGYEQIAEAADIAFER